MGRQQKLKGGSFKFVRLAPNMKGNDSIVPQRPAVRLGNKYLSGHKLPLQVSDVGLIYQRFPKRDLVLQVHLPDCHAKLLQ